MFAFALYDARRRELCLVRDRLGIKPLYVCQVSSQTLMFASEVRTLLESGLVARRLDPAAVRSYLAFGAASAPWTLVQGVESILPGESWRIDLAAGGIAPKKNRYWSPPFTREKNSVGYREAIDRIRPVLLESLSQHMLADVPVGVFLSGGIDSSAIVAGLTYQGHRPRTFSIRFGEQAFDESAHARTVAAHFGTEHVELHTSPESVFADLDAALAAYDQPSIDGLNSFFISQAVHRAGIKVAMSGLGGDELFAGYSTFRLAALLDHQLVRTLAKAAYPVLSHYAPGTMRADKLAAILASGGSRLKTYAVFRQVMLRERRAELLQAQQDNEPPLPSAMIDELSAAIAPLDSPNAYSLLELSLYLANMLLRDTDQMSMAHSLGSARAAARPPPAGSGGRSAGLFEAGRPASRVEKTPAARCPAGAAAAGGAQPTENGLRVSLGTMAAPRAARGGRPRAGRRGDDPSHGPGPAGRAESMVALPAVAAGRQVFGYPLARAPVFLGPCQQDEPLIPRSPMTCDHSATAQQHGVGQAGPEMNSDHLHLGCGLQSPRGWLNVDGSWQVVLARHRWLKQLLIKLRILPASQAEVTWGTNILRLNLARPLPFSTGRFQAVYSSHTLEHLYRDDASALVRECCARVAAGRCLPDRGARRAGVCREVSCRACGSSVDGRRRVDDSLEHASAADWPRACAGCISG